MLPGKRNVGAATGGAQCVRGRQGGTGCDQTMGAAHGESKRYPSPRRDVRGVAEGPRGEGGTGPGPVGLRQL